MRRIVSFFVDNPMIVNVMIITLMIMGFIVGQNLKKESYPDVSFNVIRITTSSEGTSLRDTELLITKPIEDQLKTISGIEKFESNSSAGFSRLNVWLNVWGTEKYEATQAIREAVSIASKKFPDNTDASIIKEIKGADTPVIRYLIKSSTLSPLEMHDLAKDFQQTLEVVQGVSEVDLSGFRDREIQINFDQEKMLKESISVIDLNKAISNYVVRESGGNLNGAGVNRNVQILTDFERTKDIQNINIRRNFNSRGINVKDISTVKDSLADRTLYVRGNLEPGITVSVYKEDAQDNFKVLDRITRVVEKFNKTIQLRYSRVPEKIKQLLQEMQKSPLFFGSYENISREILGYYGYNVSILSFKDATVETKNLLKITAHDAYLGVILVFIVLWVFLDFRTAFWTASSIPIVILLVFIAVFFRGSSINNMMLFGIITALGLLVDYGIVTAENIYRLRALGYTPRNASIEGVIQLIPPLFATMLTKVCVFLPILMVNKIDFLYIREMPLMIILTLIMALVEVFLSLPAHLAQIKKTKNYENLEGENKLSFGDRFMLWVKHKYIRILYWTAKWRYIVIFFFISLICSAIFLSHFIRFQYYSNEENDDIEIRLTAPDGTNLEEMNNKVSLLEDQIIKTIGDLGNPIVAMFTTVGSGALAPTDGTSSNANQGTIRLYLNSFSERSMSAADIVRKIEGSVKNKNGLSNFLNFPYIQRDPIVKEFLLNPTYKLFVKVYDIYQQFLSPSSTIKVGYKEWLEDYQKRELHVTNVDPYAVFREEVKDYIRTQFGFTRLNITEAAFGPRQASPIELRIVGNNDNFREKAMQEMYTFLSGIHGVFAIEEKKNNQGQDFFLHLDVRKMELLGITPSNVATTVRTALLGTQVGTIANPDESVEMNVVFSERDRGSLKNLMNLPLPTSYNTVIPLYKVATLELHQDISSVIRQNGKRSSTLTASVDVKENDVHKVSNVLDSYIPELLIKYPGIGIIKGGDMGDMEDTAKDALIIGMLGLVGVFFILLFIFRSLSQPIFVLSVLPFGIIGVIYAFVLHNQEMTFFGLVGVIGLTGVLINDSIIMVDYINILLRTEKEKSFLEAVCTGAAERIRPVLLTTITAVVGLLPSIYGWGGSVSVLRPLAMALGYGVLFGTLITLFLVPCMYLMNEDLKKSIKWTKNKIRNLFIKGKKNGAKHS